MSRAETKQRKAQARRDKRKADKNKTGDSDDDFDALSRQLEAAGLYIRKVEGDGNCLFRALSDQLFGRDSQHAQLRKDVAQYIRDNRSDFEPFLADTSFERHVDLLSKDGTYAGNDSLVAFSRLQCVDVVIHQVNAPLWRVEGAAMARSAAAKPELHVSYHNGDHYNSVRRNDERNAVAPAAVKIKTVPRGAESPAGSDARSRFDGDAEEASDLSDYENIPANVTRVMRKSGIMDESLALQALELNANCVEAAVDHILTLHTIDNQVSSASNNLWSSGGTGNRIFGDEASTLATTKASASPQTRLANVQHKLKQPGGHLSNRRRKELKRVERKLAADVRKREEDGGDNNDNASNVQPVVANMQALSI